MSTLGYTCPGGRCQGSRLISSWKPFGLAQRVEFTLAPDASAGVQLSRTEAGL